MKRLFFLLGFLLLLIPVQGQIIRASGAYNKVAAGSTLTNGLISVWELDESSGDAIDDVGGYDGTVTGATQNAAGKIGTAYSFDGGDKVDMGDVAALEPTTFTISVWMLTSTSDFICVVSNFESATPGGFHLSTELENIKISISNNPLGSHNITGSDDVVDGGWHQIVASYDGANISLYVDGDEDVSSPTVAHAPTYTAVSTFQIGASESSYNFTGSIDAVRLWDRALTGTEVTELFTKENAGTDYPW